MFFVQRLVFEVASYGFHNSNDSIQLRIDDVLIGFH